MRKERERSHPDHAMNPLTSPFFELNKIQLRLRLQIAPFDFAREPRAQITPRTQSLDHAFDFAEIAPQDRTDHTEIAPIAPQDRTETTPIAPRSHQSLSFPIQCRRPPLILIYLSLSLPSSLNQTEFDEFFWLGFVSVFIY